MRHLLSITDLGAQTLSNLIDRGLAIARGEAQAVRPLAGKIVGIYFRRPSTRTRTSFSVAALKLGADIITYGPNDLQIVTGESIQDTARVLSGFLDILVVRTNETLEEMKALATQDAMSIVNAMSENEHPTQAIADLITIHEALGSLDGVHILYIGEGNNSAAALAMAVGLTRGMRLTLVTPEGYGLPHSVLAQTRMLTRQSGASIEQYHDLQHLPTNVDVVYTTRWETMGEPKSDTNWRQKFDPYRVTPTLMKHVSKRAGTIFLHDLPAMRGSEVVNEVLDGAQSRAFQQARHKLTSAMVVLSWCAEVY